MDGQLYPPSEDVFGGKNLSSWWRGPWILLSSNSRHLQKNKRFVWRSLWSIVYRKQNRCQMHAFILESGNWIDVNEAAAFFLKQFPRNPSRAWMFRAIGGNRETARKLGHPRDMFPQAIGRSIKKQFVKASHTGLTHFWFRLRPVTLRLSLRSLFAATEKRNKGQAPCYS